MRSPACWRLAVVAQLGQDRHPLYRLTSGGLGPGKAGGVSVACSCPVLEVGGRGDCSWPRSCLSNWTLTVYIARGRQSLDVCVPSALGVRDGGMGRWVFRRSSYLGHWLRPGPPLLQALRSSPVPSDPRLTPSSASPRLFLLPSQGRCLQSTEDLAPCHFSFTERGHRAAWMGALAGNS